MRLVLLLVLFATPSFANAATVYLDPENGRYGRGDTMVVTVRIDNNDECINAVEAQLAYDPALLRAVDFSRGGSMLSLWTEEPALDTTAGAVRFSGGIPGGYCGRIQGDPALSNVLGKVVFTVLGSSGVATITLTPQTHVYRHDGQGTRAETKLQGAQFSLVAVPTRTENPWLAEVDADTIPPDVFSVDVYSTAGIFGGRYYAAFSTVDKQSGVDHYDVRENGVWRPVESPYLVKDQSLRSGVEIRAIDKAGNERIAVYVEGTAPPRTFARTDLVPLAIALGLIAFVAIVRTTVLRARSRLRV